MSGEKIYSDLPSLLLSAVLASGLGVREVQVALHTLRRARKSWFAASALAPTSLPALQVPVVPGLRVLVLDQDESGGPHICLKLILVPMGLQNLQSLDWLPKILTL